MQGLLDGFDQVVDREWLVNDGASELFRIVGWQNGAAHKQDGDFDAVFSQASGEFFAVHQRHFDVGEDEIEVCRFREAEIEGHFPVGSGGYVEGALLENGGHEAENGRFVVDDECSMQGQG